MKKTNIAPVTGGKSPKRVFERFVSALLRVPKKEVDEKQLEINAARRAKKMVSKKL